MKINSKRLVGILLCLAMVLAVLPVAALAAGTTKLYCAAPDGWEICNVYWWGSAGTNPGWPGEAMTKGSDGLWYYEVPSDATNVIFNNKVGDNGVQTDDLVMPTDSKVQFNYSAKEWVVYGSDVPVVETVYYLRGTMNSWGTSNPLTKNADGTYSVTVSLAAGDYTYKVGTEDWAWSCPSVDTALSVKSDCDVTFVLDVDGYTVTVSGSGLGDAPVVEEGYFLRGDMNAWAADDTSKMTDNGDGTYSITMELVAGTYEYKAGNADWTYGCPNENAVLVVAEDCAVTFVLNINDNTLVASGDGLDSFVSDGYYVAGEAGLCGSEWAVDDDANKMEEVSADIYEITFTDVAAGEYQFKVTNGSWSQCWGDYEGPEGNYVVTVDVVSDVVITFDYSTESISVEVIPTAAADVTEPTTEPTTEATEPTTEATEPTTEATEPTTEATEPTTEATEPTTEATEPTTEATEPTTEATEDTAPVLSEYRVVGNTDWLGNWDAAHEAGRMTQVAEGVYEITFKNVAAGEYQFKVTNGTWDQNWGGDGPDGNYMLNVPEAGDITITFKIADGSISVKLPTTPETGDVSIAAICVAMLAATAGLVCTVSKKKEF